MGKNINPLISKLEKAIAEYDESICFKTKRIYFIDSFIYIQEKYCAFDELMKKKKLFYSTVKNWEKDLTRDNVEFYLICGEYESYFISLFDPYDYLQKTEVLDLYKFKPKDIDVNVLKKL